ncbi:oligosaccharide repeat unit polymerase [Thiopseudomonas denitrificans]|uniref:Oligosaccharide repeat unit polymerase n=2 Tax=Thiopseudomonas denitrificans TaxID=1501432 RepID=A0A4R6TZ36_9GAMM|nr:oligosaccharide repeat unit polymerase [Thiopseudomonas denitrificans]
MFFLNKDLLSPGKLFFIFTFLFYLGVFADDVSSLTIFAYLFLMTALAVVAFVDLRVPLSGLFRKQIVPVGKYIVLFLLFLPALFLKIKMVVDEGGIIAYLMSLAFRVIEFEGRGWVLVLFSSVQIVYVYLCYIFMLDNRKNLLKFCFIFLSTIIFLFIGITSGSRSSLLMPLVSVLVMRHYLVKRISIMAIAGCLILFLFFIAFYGAFRNDFGGSGFSEFSLSKLNFAHFYYGTNPLEILASSDVNEPLLGATYATFLTNFLPRGLYPEKPDTGGLVFTKIYTGDQWGGMSNLAPGSFVEGIMNFGLIPGFLFGGFLTIVIMISSVCLFRKSILYFFSGGSDFYFKGFFFIAAFNYVLVAARFSYSEFTNVFFSFILFVLFPLSVSYFFLRLKVRL